MYVRPETTYLLDDLLRDLNDGHNIRGTVIVQARSMLRAEGPDDLKPLGETEFANGVAAMSASGIYGSSRVCAGIVGFVDLSKGEIVRDVLERHISAAGGLHGNGGRFRGIRQPLTWDHDKSLLNPLYSTSEDMMDSDGFRAGFAQLAPLGLSFDAWVYFHQLRRLAALAQRFPDTAIVVNHCGGVVGIAGYERSRDHVFQEWHEGIKHLSACANVVIKLSGLGMRLSGFGFSEKSTAPSSIELAQAWRPWIEACIEAFGSDRCMYGSNFPVDKGSYRYGIGINALKRLTAGGSASDKANVFWRTAATRYRLSSALLGINDNHLAS